MTVKQELEQLELIAIQAMDKWSWETGQCASHDAALSACKQAFLLGARTALEAAAREAQDQYKGYLEVQSVSRAIAAGVVRDRIRSLAEHPERLLGE